MPDVFEAPLAAAPLDEGPLTVSPARLVPPSALHHHSRQRRAFLPMSAGVEVTARGGLRLNNHHYPSDDRHHMHHHHHHHHHLDPHGHHRRRPAAAAVRCLADIDRTMRANERWVLLNKETFQEIFDATLHEMTRSPEELLDEKHVTRDTAASDGDSSNNNKIISNNNKTPGHRRTCSSSECSSGTYSEPEQDVTPSPVTSPSVCRPGQALTAAAPTESAKLTVALSDITNEGQGQQRYQSVVVTSQTVSDSSVASPAASQQVGTDRENEPLDLSMNRSPSVEVVASPGSDRVELLASTSGSSSATSDVSAISQKQVMPCVTSATTSTNAMPVSSVSAGISRPGRVSPGRASGNGGSDEPHHHHHRHHHRHRPHQNHHNAPSLSSAVPTPLAASGAGGSSGALYDLKAASPRGSGSSGGSVCVAGSSANKMPARRGSLPAAAVGGGGGSGSGRSASPRDRPTAEVAAATLSAASRAMTTTTSSPLLPSRPAAAAATLANMKVRGENWVPFNKDAVYGIVEDVIHQLEDQKGSDIKPQSAARSANTGLKSKMPSSPNSYSSSASSKSHHRLDKRGMNDFSPSRRASPVDCESCSGSEECVSGDDSNGSNSRLQKPRPPRAQPGSSVGVYDTHVGKQNSLVPMCNLSHSRRVSGASSAVVGGGQTSQEGGVPAMDTAAEGDHALPTPLTDRHLVSGVISASGASTQSGSANSSPTSKVKQCWVALDKMFVFDIVDSAMRKADDTKGDSDDGSNDGQHAPAKDPPECRTDTKVDRKEPSVSSAEKVPIEGASKEGLGGRCLKRRNDGANDNVCMSKKRREGGGQDSGVTSPLPAPTAPHSPNNAVCSSGHGGSVSSVSSECHTAGNCLEDLLAESNSQKVGAKKCGDRSTPNSPQVSQRNSPVARELGNMHLGGSQGAGIDQASSEKVATAKQENIKGAHALTPVIRTLCSMSENNQCALSDTKESDGNRGTHARSGGRREADPRQAADDNDGSLPATHGLVPVSASSTKDARSSPRLGWIAVSKVDVHNIIDSVVDSMIADDVLTSSPVRTAQSPVPSSSAGRQVSPASSPLPARDADSSTAASPHPPSSAGSSSEKQPAVDRTQSPLADGGGGGGRDSGAQSPVPASSPQSPRSPGEAHDRNSDLRSTKAFKWKSSLLMRVNEENKPDVQLPSPATANARASSSKQKNDSKNGRCGRRAGTTRKHTK